MWEGAPIGHTTQQIWGIHGTAPVSMITCLLRFSLWRLWSLSMTSVMITCLLLRFRWQGRGRGRRKVGCLFERLRRQNIRSSCVCVCVFVRVCVCVCVCESHTWRHTSCWRFANNIPCIDLCNKLLHITVCTSYYVFRYAQCVHVKLWIFSCIAVGSEWWSV